MLNPGPALGALTVVPEGESFSIRMKDTDGWTEVARVTPGHVIFPYFRVGGCVMANAFKIRRSPAEMVGQIVQDLTEFGERFVHRMTSDSRDILGVSCENWRFN